MTIRVIAGLLAFGLMTAVSRAGVEGEGRKSMGSLLVAEKGARSLAIIDGAGGTVVGTVAQGGVTGHEVAASPDGKLAFVPIYGNSGVGKPGTDGREIVVIDVPSRKVVNSIRFDHGVRPHFPVFGPKDGLLYVTTELDKSVTVIDPGSLKIVGTIPTGEPESHMLALSHDGRHGYTANVGPGTVSVLDLKARSLVRVIPIAPTVQRISVSIDDTMIFTADQSQPRLAVIDAGTMTLQRWIALPSLGYGSASTPDGRSLLVALPATNEVAVVDLAAMKVVRRVTVAATPQAVLIRPDGKLAYVSCDLSNQVAEINLGTWKVTRNIRTGKLADGMAWAAAH